MYLECVLKYCSTVMNMARKKGPLLACTFCDNIVAQEKNINQNKLNTCVKDVK